MIYAMLILLWIFAVGMFAYFFKLHRLNHAILTEIMEYIDRQGGFTRTKEKL